MQCRECQFDNPDGMKFCGECGAKLERICPDCGFSNPPQFNFCGECGTKLTTPLDTNQVPLSNPQSYTPKHLAEKILNTRSTLEGERKIVTVMFSDVADYTRIAEQLDPEDVHEILNGCFKIMMEEIHRHEGTINQFTGDGIMALFGAPLAHEDHAQRACYAALAVRDAIKAYGGRVGHKHGIVFELRIGLNTGPVVVGAIGDDLRMDYTAIGDTTNLAARIQEASSAGEVWMSFNTQQMVQDYFRDESMGEVDLKGKREPQRVYRLLSKKSDVRSRLDVSLVRGMTEFTGRITELAALQSAYQKVKNGQTQIIDLVGEAGVGKSRLVYEFRKTIHDNVSFLTGFCVQHGRTINFHPVIDIVREAFKITDTMPEPEIDKRIKELAIDNLSTMVPFYQSLLGVDVDDIQFKSLNPEGRKFGLFEAVKVILLRLCKNQPLIIILEDVHWIDSISGEFFAFLSRSIENHPIMLLTSYRPEGNPSWSQGAHYQRIGLERLGNDASVQLVRNVLRSFELDTDIERKISDKAGGNPLFTEEIIRELIARGDLVKVGDSYQYTHRAIELKIPGTVQGVVAARLDRLNDDLKRTIQIASVIGQTFELKLLETISEDDNVLADHLRKLIDLGLLAEKALYPTIEYSFNHALIREISYESLIKQKRSEIHGRIALAVEKFHADKLEKYYELLAHHWGMGDTPSKTIHYLILAGEKSNRNQAVSAAIEFFNGALTQIERSDQPPDAKLELRIKFGRANAFHSMGKIEESIRDYKDAIHIARDLDDHKSLLECLTSIAWTVYNTTFKDELPDYCEQGMKLAREMNDKGAEARLMANYAYWRYHWQGSDEYETINLAFEMAEDSQQRSPMIVVRLLLALLEYWRGNPKRSLQLSKSTVQKLHSAFNIQAASMLSAFHGYSLIQMGRYQDGIRHLRQLADVLEQNVIYSNLGRCYNGLGWAYSEIYDLEKAISNNNLALDNVKTLKGSIALSPSSLHAHAMTEVNLIENKFEMGKYDEANDHINRFIEISDRSDYDYMRDRWTIRMNGLRAYLLLFEGELRRAKTIARECLDTSVKKRWTKYIGKAKRLLAEISIKENAYGRAEKDLQSSLQLLNEVGNPKQLWLTHFTLGKLYGRMARPDQRQRQLMAAIRVIQGTANSLEAPQQEIFLSATPIREILEQGKN